jgi:hypothetical protein
LRGAGNDSGVEPEEQAAKRADCDALHQQGIEFGVHARSLFAIRYSLFAKQSQELFPND